MLQSKKPSSMNLFILFFSVFVVFCTFAAQQNFSMSAVFSAQSRTFIVQGIATISFSLVSVILYNFFNNNDLRLDIIRRSGGAPAHLIENLLDSVKIYGGRYCRDYRVKITLTPPPEENLPFLICRIEYDYHKLLPPHQLNFHLLRVQTPEQEDSVRKANSGGYLNNELFYVANEIALLDLIESENLTKYYKIGNLRIDGNPIKLTPLKNDPLLLQVNYKSKSEGSMSKVRYELEFPVELESMVFATIEVPTHGFSCRFDYTQVKHLITVNSQEFFSSQLTPSISDIIENGIHEHEYSDWLLPKSTALFTWWSNDNQSSSLESKQRKDVIK